MIRGSIGYWIWVPPLIAILFVVWWTRTAQGNLLHFSGLTSPLGWIPGVGRLANRFLCYTLARLVAMLVENNVPLDEGIVLAAQATGSANWIQSAREMAAAIQRGDPAAAHCSRTSFPPYLRWLIGQQFDAGPRTQALQAAADGYRRQAAMLADRLQTWLPVGLCVGIGGTATLLFALSVFLPLIEMLNGLVNP